MLQYLSSGHFTSEKEWIHPQRQIDSYEIIYVLQGHIYLEENSIPYTLIPNDILLLEPGLLHRGLRQSENVEFFWLHFTGNRAYSFKYAHPKDNYEIKHQFKRILHMSNTPGYTECALNAAVTLLTSEIEYQNKFASSFHENALSNQICEYIRIHASRPLTVANVAKQFDYTQGYISKFFKATQQINLKTYIETERIKYAKNLLITTNIPIKEISHSMGYQNEKSFIKFFTYHEGISPSKFRNIFFHTHQNNK
jgi:YesN/AraC family two-component response regulator